MHDSKERMMAYVLLCKNGICCASEFAAQLSGLKNFAEEKFSPPFQWTGPGGGPGDKGGADSRRMKCRH